MKSDGTIWFTDPGYNSGITKPHAGYPPDYYVYQFHPTNGDGLYIFAAGDGHLIGKIKFLRLVNLCWGGPQYKTLYMVGQPLVTSIPVLVAGTPSLKKLQSTLKGRRVILSWPAPSTGFALQETELLTPLSSWTPSPLPITITNNQMTAGLDATNPAKFFRLRLN